MSDYTYPPDRINPSRWLILVYIEEFCRSHHRYPKVQEVARAFGIPRPHVYSFLKSQSAKQAAQERSLDLMTERNQKLQLILSAWQQANAGELSAEQALTRCVWGMLEPVEKKVLGYAVQCGQVTAADLVERFQLSKGHASTELKQLFDYGLLVREAHTDDVGLRYVYRPAAGVANV